MLRGTLRGGKNGVLPAFKSKAALIPPAFAPFTAKFLHNSMPLSKYLWRIQGNADILFTYEKANKTREQR
jgi:hypothetical protein